MKQNFTVIIDSREQTPWEFPTYVPTTVKKLDCGDYSIVDYEHIISIERKSKSDAISTIIHNKKRFYKELAKLKLINDTGGLAVIIVEASLTDLLEPKARRDAHPQSIIGGLAAVHVLFGVPVLFCGGRAEAAAYGWALMRHFMEKLER